MNTVDVARVLAERAALDTRHLGGQAFAQVVQQRMTRLGLDAAAYVRRLEEDPSELEALVGNVAVPETWLFRYPQSFELLVDVLREARARGPIRMLSAGCAAGQEPFSMAAAALHAGCDPLTTRIVAVDRRRDLIDVAARGELPEAPRRHPVPSWASRWFDRTGVECRVDPALLALVEFHAGDLLAFPLPPGSFCAIFCRNVLIYLGDDARRSVMARVVNALAPSGTLFLGHADRPSDSPRPLERTGGVQTFAFQLATPTVATATRPASAGLSTAQIPCTPGVTVRRAPTTTTAESRTPHAGHQEHSRGDASVELVHAQRLADEGRLVEAAAAVRAVAARGGTSAATAEVLGHIALAGQDLPTARRHLEEAVYLEPRRASALLSLALVLERLGEGSRASSIRARARRAAAAASP